MTRQPRTKFTDGLQPREEKTTKPCPKCKSARTKLITKDGEGPPGYERRTGKQDCMCLVCNHIFPEVSSKTNS